MSKMDNTVFVIRDNNIDEMSYRDLFDYVQTTTRPHGVDTRYYITTDADNVWSVACWRSWGKPEHIISRHQSEEEAQAAVEEIWICEIKASPDLTLFYSREDAEAFLAEKQDVSESPSP